MLATVSRPVNQSNGWHGQVQAWLLTVVLGWDMQGADQLFALTAFQVNIKAPETMQVLEHCFGRFAQGFALVLLVTQGQ